MRYVLSVLLLPVLLPTTTCVLSVFTGAPSDQKDAPKRLPQEIVEAWREAGAEVGWMRSHGQRTLTEVRAILVWGVDEVDFLELAPHGMPGDLPAFGFSARAFLGFPWEEGLLAKLP